MNLLFRADIVQTSWIPHRARTTQSLSSLRFVHAYLTEEHGSNVALLRHREQGITELQTCSTKAQEQLKDLRAEVRTLKHYTMRSEHKVTLAEREVSFLQAILVRTLRILLCCNLAHRPQAVYRAKEAAHDEGLGRMKIECGR